MAPPVGLPGARFGAVAACLDFTDDKAGGEVEMMAFDNTGAEPVTVYPALDARRAPAGAERGESTFDLPCQSNVAMQKRSLGSVRSLYRDMGEISRS